VFSETQSSGPAGRFTSAQQAVATTSEPSLAHAPSLTRVRARVNVRRRRRVDVCGCGGAQSIGAGSRQGPGPRATCGVYWCTQAGECQEEALTAMLACTAARRDATSLCLLLRLLGGGQGAAGKGCWIECDDDCEHRAPPTVHLAHSPTCRMRTATSRGCTCMYISLAV
jgi:hypothetical protein